MNSQKAGLRVAAIFFGVFCLVHLWRLIAHVHVRVGQYKVGAWVSVVALIIAGALSIWLWMLSAKR
jgi:hypothetical protein